MADLGSLRCHNCNMIFRSYPLLDKHKEKFCIGSQIGDPTILSSRYVDPVTHIHLPDRDFPRMAETPDFKTRDSIARLRARENLLNDREQRLTGRFDGQLGSVSDSKALRSLTDEFHKLRKSLEVSVPTLRSFQLQGDSGLSSQWDREYRERMQDVAEAHERHLADIQARNHALEIQREEIRQRLSDVTSNGSSTNHIEQMLLELKAQEEKNQLALDALRDQVGLIQSENRAKAEKTDKERPTSSSVMKDKASLTFIPFPLHGSRLSSEISALQMAYVQGGGGDPSVLAQMRDLQAEVLAFEEMSHKQDRKEKKKKRHDGAPRALDVELMAVEMENRRLEEEIFNLKLQQSRKKANNGDSEIQEMQREHLQQMAQLQADMELLRRDVRMPPRGGHGPPPFQPPPMAPPLPPPIHPSRPPLGRPQPAIALGALDSMRPQSPPGNRHILEPLDALGPAPYDPVAGFVIFYDFILGLEPTYQKVRVLSGLYSNGHRMGQSSSLPDAPCDMWNPSQHLAHASRGNTAMLCAKQPIPRVRPSSSIALVMELQAAGGFNPYGQEVQHMSSCGWTKLDLFDHHNQVLSGRWKLPVRALPLRPGLSTGQLNAVPQVGKAELYLRVINGRDGRDAELQAMAEIDPRNSPLYLYPPLIPGPSVSIGDNPAPLLAQQPPASFHLSPYTDYIDPPPVQELPNLQKPRQRDNIMAEKGQLDASGGGKRVGFIIDRVTDAPPGDGTLRLTGYHMNTGQVIHTQGKGMSCIVSAVSSSIQHGSFIFGEQEAIFTHVSPEEDMMLMLRFYHWPGGSTAWAPWEKQRGLPPLLASEEWAAAWTVVRLTRPQSPDTGADRADPGNHQFVWDTGTQDLPLYHSPAPPVLSLPAIRLDRFGEMFEPYGNARVRLCIFSSTKPDFPFPPESPNIDSDSNAAPKGVYIAHSRRKPLTEPYSSKDLIRLFIHGARFLPDAVTVTLVTGRIFDKNFDQIGPDICTRIDLNSDIFQPFYNYAVQINVPNIPPSSTLLLKVYTIDRFTRDVGLVGWAAVNLFVESGTQKVPRSDAGGVQVSLNEGAHQIRVYHRSPPTDHPFSVESLTSSGCTVPCATLLVCIKKAPNDRSQHHAGDLSTIEQYPEYETGVYLSDAARPIRGEILLYRAMMNRSVVQVRDVIPLLAGNSQRLVSDEQLSDWVQKTFAEKMKVIPHPMRLCCVSQYNVTSGVKVSLDAAHNLPWSGFTFAHICFNPPAALYYGHPWTKYDRPVSVDEIDLDSDQKCPVWRDGYKTFTHRIFDQYLTVIFHLHEIMTKEPEGSDPDPKQARPEPGAAEESPFVFIPGAQAWSALRVFYKSYCNLGVYQLPLYQGTPSLTVLHTLRSGDCAEKLQELEQKEMITRLTGASLTVRIADGRRQEELSNCGPQDIIQTYLPADTIDSYTALPSGRKLTELIPAGHQDGFKKRLIKWYRKYLIYYRPATEKDTAQHRPGTATRDHPGAVQPDPTEQNT
ncbi:coiled-coil domain-containing protein 17 [Mixophyes fleayi]|uniref:coiled-coil domain-containing protein 17 n=1 Tax=Mixophyes fleayi TaxID=3061075 RepID=UPI003F4E2571